MIDNLIAAAQRLLPLRIREVEWNDPVLTMGGPDWSLSTLSSWRVVMDGRLTYGWSQPDAGDRVWDLCGLSIVGIEAQSTSAPVDPTFHLSDGARFEVFSDNAVDPWVLRLSEVTIVGDPSA